jgi:hypothetical protein
MPELDYWSFTTNAGTDSFTVAAPAFAPSVTGDLHPKIEILDSSGKVMLGWQDPDSSSASWSGTLAAGSYYLVVASHGISSLATSTNYGFDVGSYRISGTVQTSPTSVAAPTNLTAAAVSSSQINLSWTDNASNATSYSVERSTDGTTWSQIASLSATSTSYSDTGLASGSTYYYRVRAFDGTISSAYSNQASASTPTAQAPPAAPSNLVATAVSATRIHLTWTDNANNETGFAIERAVYGKNGTLGSWTQIATVGPSPGTGGTVSYNDTTVSSRKSYSYRVRAYNASGYSAYTNPTSQLAGGPTLALTASTAIGEAGGLTTGTLPPAFTVSSKLVANTTVSVDSLGDAFWLAQTPAASGGNADGTTHTAVLLEGSGGSNPTVITSGDSSTPQTRRSTERTAWVSLENNRLSRWLGDSTGSGQEWLDAVSPRSGRKS